MYLGDGYISQGARTQRLRITLDAGCRKHERSNELEPWQQAVVEREPAAFIRGLFHSDGSYFQNPVRAPSGVRYSYDRYYFSNRSHDIKALFAWACTLIGVETRPVGRWHVSVGRRASVARLNEFLGPKR